MKYTLLVRPEAEEDLRRAYSWYEDQKAGLGDDFLLCIDAALSQIQHNPLQFPCIHKEARRAIARPFPYSIFSVLSRRAISVIAVFHFSRDPGKWRNRLADEEENDD